MKKAMTLLLAALMLLGACAAAQELRVDFYEVDGKLYFGEVTFYHFSGFMPFQPDKWDKIFGGWLKLPGKRNLK